MKSFTYSCVVNCIMKSLNPPSLSSKSRDHTPEVKSSHCNSDKVELEKQLAAALTELNELRRIAAIHEKCPKSQTSLYTSEQKVTPISSSSVMQETIRHQSHHEKVELCKGTVKPREPSRVRLITGNHGRKSNSNEIKKTHDLPSTESSADVAKDLLPLTPSLLKVKILLQRRRTEISTYYNASLTSTVGVHSSSSQANEEQVCSSHTFTGDLSELSQKGAVTDISNYENKSQQSRVTGSPFKRFKTEEFKHSVELQHLNYLEPSIVPSSSLEESGKPDLQTLILDPGKTSLILHQPKEDILRVFLVQDTRKVPSSTNWIEEVAPEPSQKPLWIIVSKHEFEAVLLQRKKYVLETEVAMPVEQDDSIRCRMEICIYDLEMENRLLDNLSNIEREPKVYVMWSFLGLDQKTVTMPAAHAHFHTNVAYWGPLSVNMTDFVKQHEVPVTLMLERSDGSVMMVGEGNLDITPAINQPQRGFLRCVALNGSHGSATVYCSFKLHSCCKDEDLPTVETLEIGLGHLQLRPGSLTTSPATHLYVEYTLLGQCGPELETDSVPKGEVMNFNYNKTLHVHEGNADKLEPLLNRDNPKNLTFILLAEPCSLTEDTEVEEVGYAEVNLLKDMVDKDKDIISNQVPLYSSTGENIGSLSVTVLGLSTIQNHTKAKTRTL